MSDLVGNPKDRVSHDAAYRTAEVMTTTLETECSTTIVWHDKSCKLAHIIFFCWPKTSKVTFFLSISGHEIGIKLFGIELDYNAEL